MWHDTSIFLLNEFCELMNFIPQQTGDALRSDILKSMKQLVNWSEEDPHEVNVNYKLYQLLQTSPSILFYQKIANKEYGEAILLANKFGLDKNEVYKAQWKMNNSHISAINVSLLFGPI